jgi:parallel beta-helix repeat protein
LKINSSSPDVAYGLQILGNAYIDSVRISSWNYSSNDYAQNHADGKVPRAYIRVGPNSTGTSRITNSELSYLGSSFYHRSQGLTYLSGKGNVLINNTIHHMWYGFYSEGVGNMIIEDNNVYDNIKYGIDPHTGTHDILIRNNRVHDNGHIGIICSVDCKNITIDGNQVSNNTGTGIMLSINMQQSIVTNNIVNNENAGIEISQSHNNGVYKNIVKKSNEGIEIHNASSGNNVHDNLVDNSSTCGIQINDNNSLRNTISDNYIINSTTKGICLFGGASENTVSQNNVSSTSLYAIYVKDPNTVDNLFKNNTLFNTSAAAIRLIDNSKSVFISNHIYNTAGDEYSLANGSTMTLLNTTFSSGIINSTNGLNSVTISNVDKRPIKNDRNIANIMNSTSVTLSFRLAAGEHITLTTAS